MNNRAYHLIALLTIIALGSLALLTYVTDRQKIVYGVAEQESANLVVVDFDPTAFAGLNLKAKSALVYDPVAGRAIYSLEPGRQLPIASLTKLMTALVAADLMPPDREIAAGGEKWRLGDLSDYMLVVSSNSGALAIASAVAAISQHDFVSLMNERAKQIGLSNTFFINPTGLDLNLSVAGSYSSVEDVAKLLAYVVSTHPGILEATRNENLETETLDNRRVVGHNTNEAIHLLPGLVASKTGFTDVANGNLAVVIDRGLNQPVVIVVLGSGIEGRFSDVSKLVGATLNAYGSKHN